MAAMREYFRASFMTRFLSALVRRILEREESIRIVRK